MADLAILYFLFSLISRSRSDYFTSAVHFKTGFRAARTSSGLETGVLCGASCRKSAGSSRICCLGAAEICRPGGRRARGGSRPAPVEPAIRDLG